MAFEREKHIAELIARYVTGKITAQESKELEAWLAERPANRETFDRMLSRSEFERNVERFTKSDRDAAREWRRIENRGPHRKKSRRLIIVRYAAAMAVVAISIVGYYTLREKAQKTAVIAENNIVRAESVPVLLLGDGRKVELTPDVNNALLQGEHLSLDTASMSLVYDKGGDTFIPATHSLFVPKGSDHRLVLSDNTVVWLNAESSLTYPAVFKGSERRVELRGEAYFEVAKDAAHPFIVKAGGVDVTVTGTTFSVRAYGNEPVVRTVLESGSVSVSAEVDYTRLNAGGTISQDLPGTDRPEEVKRIYDAEFDWLNQ